VYKDPDAYYEEESIVEASPVSTSQTPNDLRYQRILDLYRTSSSKSSSRSIDDDFDDDFDDDIYNDYDDYVDDDFDDDDYEDDEDDDDEDDDDNDMIITSKNNNIKTIQYRRVIDDDEE
jgi:hypothetical protein